MNYYNDNDPRSVAWLRELMKQNVIPLGDVDERSIKDVTRNDLKGYTQCHFFAGVGGWSEALRLAGIGSDVPIWTGSCPCQPFSNAGQRRGEKDERHLWPEFRRLITECNPPAVFGEQVASKDGRIWLSGVRTDLENLGYAVGAADLCAAGIGAPHIRQRLYWVADSDSSRGNQLLPRLSQQEPKFNRDSERFVRLADSAIKRNGRLSIQPRRSYQPDINTFRASENGGLADSSGKRLSERYHQLHSGQGEVESYGTEVNFWSNSIWLPCADGKARRIEPEIFPLAHGIPGRVGLLRGSGNAIVPQVAAEFIMAYMELIFEIERSNETI